MSRSRAVLAAIGAIAMTLAAASAAAAPGYQLRQKAGLWLLGAGDAPLLDMQPTVEVDYDTASGRLRKSVRLQLADQLRLADGSWRVSAQGRAGPARFVATLRGAPHEPRVALSVAVAYNAAVTVRREVLRLRSAALDQARVLDRAYRVVDVGRTRRFAGPLTPHRVLLRSNDSGVSLVQTRGIQGYWVRPGAGGRLTLDFELDHSANHPLVRLRGCRSRYLGKQHPLPSGWRNLVRRRPGERRRARLDWLVGPTRLPAVKRYPDGRAAAVVLIDHADQSDAPKLEALAFGASGAVAAGRVGPAYPGLVNRGLSYSKSIFVARVWPYAAHFESVPYRRLLDRLEAAGVEVGLHSLTGAADDPGSSGPLFALFRSAYRGRTWIDHQPVTNCEAVSNSGADPQSRWFMLPLLHEYGFRYLWNGDDQKLPRGSLNMLRPDRPAHRPATIYPADQLTLGAERPFVLFASVWLFNHRTRFLELFADRKLASLISAHGLAIGHVYLDTFRPGTRLQGRELLRQVSRPGEEPAYELHPRADRAFHQLAMLQQAGLLWVAGVEAVGDHLLAARRVRLRASSQAVQVSCDDCTTSAGLTGLTLSFPRTVARVRVDGGPPTGRRVSAQGLEVWFDLARGQHRSLTMFDAEGARLAPAGTMGVRLDAAPVVP